MKVVVPRNASPRGQSTNQRRNYADGAGKELWYDQSCNTDREANPDLQLRERNDMEFLWFILIGLAAGWLAGQLMKGGGFGIVGDIVVGVVGALLGGFLFRTFGVSAGGGLIGSLIVATIGACVLLFLLRLIKRPGGLGA